MTPLLPYYRSDVGRHSRGDRATTERRAALHESAPLTGAASRLRRDSSGIDDRAHCLFIAMPDAARLSLPPPLDAGMALV